MHPRSLVARALGLIRDATLFVLTLIGWFGLAAAPCVLWALALGAPESSSGADATVPLFGLLWLCCALMLSPRAIEALRRLGRARRLDDAPAPAEPPWLSPTRRAWLHETRWLLASLERAREQEAMQEVWEYVARARQLDHEARLELGRGDVLRHVATLAALLRRNGERLRRRARARLRRELAGTLRALERGLLEPRAAADPYR